MASSPPAPDVPLRIHADRAAGRLEMEWADGHRTAYDALSLRWLCPCAYCRGEGGLPGWHDSAPTLSSEQTRIAGVVLVDNYALQPTWGDGHATGFYTFGLLREHCPCDECLARAERGRSWERLAGAPSRARSLSARLDGIDGNTGLADIADDPRMV